MGAEDEEDDIDGRASIGDEEEEDDDIDSENPFYRWNTQYIVEINIINKQYSVSVLTYSPIIFSAAIMPDIIAVCVHPKNSK